MIEITAILEVDCALILSPSLHQCSVLRVFKGSQSYTKRIGLKQGYDVTGDRTRDLAHRRARSNQLSGHPCSCQKWPFPFGKRREARKLLGQERESELSKYIDLARAKCEALDNIYSLFKQI